MSFIITKLVSAMRLHTSSPLTSIVTWQNDDHGGAAGSHDQEGENWVWGGTSADCVFTQRHSRAGYFEGEGESGWFSCWEQNCSFSVIPLLHCGGVTICSLVYLYFAVVTMFYKVFHLIILPKNDVAIFFSVVERFWSYLSILTIRLTSSAKHRLHRCCSPINKML